MPKRRKRLRPVDHWPPLHQAQSTCAMAQSFASAALELLRNRKAETTVPTLYLLTHALELYLKAFLFSCGATDKELRVIGHDLVECIRACRRHGIERHLQLTRMAVVQVVRINRYYSDKELEYFVPRAKGFGSIEALADTVKCIADGIRRPITEASFREFS